MKKVLIYCCLLIQTLNVAYGQSKTKANTLNQYGIAPIFLGGLFREGLSVGQLKTRGDFGIAAPSLVDGELIEYKGNIYQTKANGETKLAPDALKVPFGMVCFFKADTAFHINGQISQQQVEQIISAQLKNINGIYAIRISGVFSKIQTRAFHKADHEPFPPVAEIQAAQQLFNYTTIKGTMIGYRMPAYMSGLSGTGYHFHFISNDTEKGGHVLSYSPQAILVEIALMKNFSLEVPNDPAFRTYQAASTAR
ncbi:acetolactate decarboxylase [Mucilaginibacter sp. CAU 1740]|uniref:acetolactate decarboxylase n=1 Tax=Mucilaginibacter sp. CAU 1740 TaxID=3140365 RepID=UPI00325A58F2